MIQVNTRAAGIPDSGLTRPGVHMGTPSQSDFARKAAEVAEARRRQPASQVHRDIAAARPPLGFAAALRRAVERGKPAIIAEIRRTSAGGSRPDFDPVGLAHELERGGATCLSVATDGMVFDGHPNHLRMVRAASSLPIMRRDFFVDSYQILESRALGADCIPLSANLLTLTVMQSLATETTALGMDVLAEIRSYRELEHVMRLKVPAERLLLGINNHRASDDVVPIDTTLSLVEHVPPEFFVVSGGGIRHRGDMALLEDAGVRALIIGEALLSQHQPGAALMDLLEDRQHRIEL